MFYHRCNFCNQAPSRLSSIEDQLGKTLKKYKFPYHLKDFETLSYKTYQCVNCGSSDRDRLYKLYLDKFQNFKKTSKVLDFAPSQLMEEYFRSKKINYRTADLLIDGVDDKVDITDMKIYKDNTFDFFICSHILEHVDDDIKALKELRRVLKPGGQGIIMSPIINKKNVFDEDISITDESERWRRFAQDDHVRLYEKNVFIERINNAGFTLKEYGWREIGLRNYLRNGLRLKSKLYIVVKSSKNDAR